MLPVGQFKDDQLKGHAHSGNGTKNYGLNAFSDGYICAGSTSNSGLVSYATGTAGSGAVNRGKRKGVKYIIKVL